MADNNRWVDIGDYGAPMWICVDEETDREVREAVAAIIERRGERSES